MCHVTMAIITSWSADIVITTRTLLMLDDVWKSTCFKRSVQCTWRITLASVMGSIIELLLTNTTNWTTFQSSRTMIVQTKYGTMG